MLSIEITDRQIKFVRGISGGSRVKIQDAGEMEFSRGMVSNGYITDVPMAAAELSGLLRTKGIREKEAVVSIASGAIAYREIRVLKPKSLNNTTAIEAMVRAEMGVLNDYGISYVISGEIIDDEKGEMLEISAAACPQSLSDGYVKLFSHAGLSLKGIYVSNHSITRLITNSPRMDNHMPMLLTQIDNGFLNMNLYEDNRVVFSRYFEIDRSYYDNEPDYVTRAVYDNLYRTLQFLKDTTAADIKELAFYGEIEDFIELSNAVSSFDIPAHILAAPPNIGFMVEIDFTKYANAIGALENGDRLFEHINLLERGYAKEKSGFKGAFMLYPSVILGGVILVAAACGIIEFADGKVKARIAETRAELEAPEFSEKISYINKLEEMTENYEGYYESVKLAGNLYQYIPKANGTIIDKLNEAAADGQPDIKKVMVIGGEVTAEFLCYGGGNPTSVPSEYVRRLSEEVKNENGAPYFTDIKYAGYTKLEYEYNGEPVYEFSVTMKLNSSAEVIENERE